ncbi:hypothetical protein PG991_009126 [Apiospora marii]|uniref:G-protein coupled receptors family 2 profile 2 domain-containing protein n=1 Tax=Apiospora marii TaxID=335849 RepID=A0ABR1RK30_9PEZI
MAGNASIFPCPAPFLDELAFPATGGYLAVVDGRLCQRFGPLSCCLPCPMTDWAYPDGFNPSSQVANWINVVGAVCCVFLLASWSFLAAEKTHRHYLSISLTCAVSFMNASCLQSRGPRLHYPPRRQARPVFQRDHSTWHELEQFMYGFGDVLDRGRLGRRHLGFPAVSVIASSDLLADRSRTGLHVAVPGTRLGWGIPVLGLAIALAKSGVSFRFGQTCHVNHHNSLAAFWVPLLVFAGLAVIMQFATFGYCIKVYLTSLANNSAPTERSEIPSYTTSVRTMAPRQAYHRVRRVIQLQWRGIAIALIIICDVIFFAVVFVFQDNVVQSAKTSDKARPWVECLAMEKVDKKNRCLQYAKDLVVPLRAVVAVLVLLAMNGICLLFLLGRWSMVTGGGNI